MLIQAVFIYFRNNIEEQRLEPPFWLLLCCGQDNVTTHSLSSCCVLFAFTTTAAATAFTVPRKFNLTHDLAQLAPVIYVNSLLHI